jgi:hypothetical protein
MTKDEILSLARKSGFQTGTRDYGDGIGDYPVVQSVATGSFMPELERFAELVAARECEACAAICLEMAKRAGGDIRTAALEVAAERIQARGQQ